MNDENTTTTTTTDTATATETRPKRKRKTIWQIRDEVRGAEKAEADRRVDREHRRTLDMAAKVIDSTGYADSIDDVSRLLAGRDRKVYAQAYVDGLRDCGLPSWVIDRLIGLPVASVRLVVAMHLETAKRCSATTSTTTANTANPQAYVQLKPTDPNDSEASLIRSGKYIEAIKELRSRTGLNLKEAKDSCDAAKARILGTVP